MSQTDNSRCTNSFSTVSLMHHRVTNINRWSSWNMKCHGVLWALAGTPSPASVTNISLRRPTTWITRRLLNQSGTKNFNHDETPGFAECSKPGCMWRDTMHEHNLSRDQLEHLPSMATGHTGTSNLQGGKTGKASTRHLTLFLVRFLTLSPLPFSAMPRVVTSRGPDDGGDGSIWALDSDGRWSTVAPISISAYTCLCVSLWGIPGAQMLLGILCRVFEFWRGPSPYCTD